MQVNFRHDPNTEVQRTRKINLAFSSLSLHTSLGLGQRNAGNENVFGFWGIRTCFPSIHSRLVENLATLLSSLSSHKMPSLSSVVLKRAFMDPNMRL